MWTPTVQHKNRVSMLRELRNGRLVDGIRGAFDFNTEVKSKFQKQLRENCDSLVQISTEVDHSSTSHFGLDACIT